MTREHIIWITIAAYVVFMLVIGLISSRSSKGMTAFTVGGRNAGAWMSALSYGTAYFSAVMFIGYAGGTGWKYGLWGVLPGIGNAVFGSLLAWLVLARRTRETTRRLKIKSMPQLFEKRFGSQPMKLFCVAVIFVFLLPYSASVYKGLTSVCAVLLKVDERVCMVVIALAAALLVILGGYMATLKADFVQGLIMLFGVGALIVAVVRCRQAGGFTAGIEAIAAKTGELNLGVRDHIGLWATVLMTSFGTWGLPQMIHKYYGIRDDKEVKRGTVISTLFALVVAGGGYFIGSLSHLFFSELPSPPAGGAGNPDYLVPNILAQAGLPDVLVGLVLVLLIAASVSTLSSITITGIVDADDGSGLPEAAAENGHPRRSAADQGAMPGICGAVLFDCQFAHADPRHDVVFLGNHFRQLSCSVPDCAVLEGNQPCRRVGGYAQRLCGGLPAGGMQAAVPGGAAAVFRKNRRPRPAFRLRSDGRVAACMRCGQPVAGRQAGNQRRRTPVFTRRPPKLRHRHNDLSGRPLRPPGNLLLVKTPEAFTFWPGQGKIESCMGSRRSIRTGANRR